MVASGSCRSRRRSLREARHGPLRGCHATPRRWAELLRSSGKTLVAPTAPKTHPAPRWAAAEAAGTGTRSAGLVDGEPLGRTPVVLKKARPLLRVEG